MIGDIANLIVLFFVIFDPLISVPIFLGATEKLDKEARFKTASLAIAVAALLSFAVLFFGLRLLNLFSTDLDDFKVAGGIILGLLGIKMVLGLPLKEAQEEEEESARAIAVVIGTPLLTGPAAITTIIISVNDFGLLVTGTAVSVVLAITALLLYSAVAVVKVLGKTSIQVMATMMGLITLAWGVMFVREGLGF